MKQLSICLALLLTMVGTVIADETVEFPFWQHGWGLSSYFQVANVNGSGGDDITVTIQLNGVRDSVATSSTISPGSIWTPDTAYWDPDNWYFTSHGQNDWGSGHLILQSTTDAALIYGVSYQVFGPVYNLILPNPNELYGSGS